MNIPKPSFWKVILAILLVPGLYYLIFRLSYRLGASTNLTDEYPWGWASNSFP